MSNTYTQIHIQSVFAVQNRISLINDSFKEKLYLYIAGIVSNCGHKLLAINGMPDHVHIVFGLRPSQSISDLMKNIKQDSSKWINKMKLVTGKFNWQDGYGAFSYSKSQLPQLLTYVQNQEKHHKKISFLEEYRNILDQLQIEYDPRYLFHEIV